MNYANEHQLIAVANACDYLDIEGPINIGSQEISCRICRNWDGKQCVIGVFDNVLTSLDQT